VAVGQQGKVNKKGPGGEFRGRAPGSGATGKKRKGIDLQTAEKKGGPNARPPSAGDEMETNVVPQGNLKRKNKKKHGGEKGVGSSPGVGTV